ncbi:unnamed protein product [Anisakis simplex]|uniref:Aa_trans domain-containing protein n=1 Tax=Anisakis simplex TaxID=6269 RepID=A0A0M3KA59_ANISI|nr:unnamed protein product [Anisakis simplex]
MSGVTVVSVNEGDDRTVSGINGRGIAEQRPTQLSSFRQPDSKPQRQFITANDVRNLVSSNPASDHNQSRNETPSLTNILTNRDGTTRHNVTDFEYSDSDGCATSFSDPPIQPKCFYVGVVPASIGGALATVFVTIAIAIYLFIILHGRSGHKAGPTSFGLIGTVLHFESL